MITLIPSSCAGLISFIQIERHRYGVDDFTNNLLDAPFMECLVADARHTHYSILLDGEEIGFVFFKADIKRLELLYITPGMRCKGIGGVVVERLDLTSVVVDRENTRAISMYRTKNLDVIFADEYF